jgi:transcriptional regulator with XRE-family HTH domain
MDKDETVNLRVKKLRHTLELTQTEMSRVLSLSGGYLAGIETGKRAVNDRFVKLLCSSFNVNEQWLRTGAGGMFVAAADPHFLKLAGLFKELQPSYREFIFKQINLLLEMQDSDKNNRLS